jgi:hypothetical protein
VRENGKKKKKKKEERKEEMVEFLMKTFGALDPILRVDGWDGGQENVLRHMHAMRAVRACALAKSGAAAGKNRARDTGQKNRGEKEGQGFCQKNERSREGRGGGCRLTELTA